MNLLRYNKISSPDIRLRAHIKAWTGKYPDELTSEAIDDWMRGRIVMHRGRPKAVPPLWRLTMPFFMIMWVLMGLVILPLRWVITGRYMLDEKSSLWRIIGPWAKKLFPIILN